MAAIYTRAKEFRAALLRGEQSAADDITQAYGQTWERISRQLEALSKEIAAAKERGETVSTAWLLRQRRLERLQAQAEQEIRTFARQASERIRQEQAAAVQAALRDSETLARLGPGTAPDTVRAALDWNRLPREAVEDLVGFTADGSPLRALLDDLPDAAGAAVRKELITGLATGQNPTRTAARIRESLGGNLDRALTIARTETLRAYRESSRRSYEANGDLVQEWEWVASLSGRSCAACLALHGRRFPTSEPMGAHPNCRCTLVPVTPSWEELGFPGIPDGRIPTQTGEEWLKKQPADVRERILGKAGARAFDAREVSLADFVQERHSADWGTTYSAGSLKAARANAAIRQVGNAPAMLRRQVQRAATPADAEAAARAYVQQHAGKVAHPVRHHGMAQAETMRTVAWDDFLFHFPDTPAGENLVVEQLTLIAQRRRPARLLTQETREITLTTRTDNLPLPPNTPPGSRVVARAGSRRIVIYGGQPLSFLDLVHEMGHNLARARYGTVTPPPTSDFAAAAAVRPLRGYAQARGLVEDFAESVRRYHRGDLQRLYPERHQVIQRLLNNPNYGG